MSFNLLVVGGGDTDWCTSGHQKTRFYLRGKIPHFKFWILVQAAWRNLGKERSEILKLAEVLSSVSPCPLIVHQQEPRGEQQVTEWFSTRTLTSQYRHLRPRQYYISLPPTPPISYYLRMFLHCRTNIYIVYIHERRGGGSPPLTSHWESKDDKVHILLGWSEDRNISQLLKVVKSTWEGFIWQ